MADHVEQQLPIPRPGIPSIQATVRDDLETREQVGIARYGDSLKQHNGRDALLDAYQEALDLAVYLRQAMMERDGTPAGEQHGADRPTLMVAPFTGLMSVRQIGEWWSWRCSLGCIYDHHCPDEATANRETVTHLATEHGIYPVGADHATGMVS